MEISIVRIVNRIVMIQNVWKHWMIFFLTLVASFSWMICWHCSFDNEHNSYYIIYDNNYLLSISFSYLEIIIIYPSKGIYTLYPTLACSMLSPFSRWKGPILFMFGYMQHSDRCVLICLSGLSPPLESILCELEPLLQEPLPSSPLLANACSLLRCHQLWRAIQQLLPHCFPWYKKNYIFKKSYFSLNLLKSKILKRTDRGRVRSFIGWRCFLEWCIDWLISHIFHNPVDSCFIVIFILDKCSFGRISSKSHSNKLVNISLWIFSSRFVNIQLITYRFCIMDQKILKV